MTKLNRSETVTVRLDPRMNYLTELAGRAQRRTKSSFIEWAVQKALRDLGVNETVGLIDRLDMALEMDAVTATDHEWTHLLGLAIEARDRLYALTFDPGATSGPVSSG